MSLIQGFNTVAESLRDCHSFKIARKKARDEFNKNISSCSPENRNSYLISLFRWATNKMHSVIPADKITALSTFAFYLDKIDDQNQYQNLSAQLEKILPVEDIEVIEGICFILERIARRSLTPILPVFFERLTQRLMAISILTPVFIMRRLIFTDDTLYDRFCGNINSIVHASIKHPNPRVRRCGIELFLKRLDRDPSSDELTLQMADDLLPVIDTNEPVIGAAEIFVALAKRQPALLQDRAPYFLAALTHRIEQNPVPELIQLFADFATFYLPHAIQFVDKLAAIFRSITIYSVPMLKIFATLIALFPDSLIEIGTNILMTLSDKLYFVLAPSILDYNEQIKDKVFQRVLNAEVSIPVIEVVAKIAQMYPYMSFKLSEYHNTLLTRMFDIDPYICLVAIGKLSFLPKTHVGQYIDKIISNTRNENPEIRKAAAIALYRALKDIEDPEKVLLCFLFNLLDEPIEEIRILAIENFPEDHILLLTSGPIFAIIEQLYNDPETNVRMSTLRLINRIRIQYPLAALNFFAKKLQEFISVYKNMPSSGERKKHMKLYPFLLKYADDIAYTFFPTSIPFFLEILNYHDHDKTDRRERHHDRTVRRCVLKCFRVISKCSPELIANNEVITAIGRQLFESSHTSLHMDVAHTLSVLFKNADMKNAGVDVIELDKTIVQFLQTCNNFYVTKEFLSFFGTTGPFDPSLFHRTDPPQTARKYSSYPISDPRKRPNCYLRFVMSYVLEKLNERSATHEPSVLIIAIVYIFQSDPTNCIAFLDEIVSIFADLLKDSVLQPPDAIFHFLRSIILLVDVSILPYADTIMNMVTPFLDPPNNLAVKTLSALAFALKGHYKFDPLIFNTMTRLLNSQPIQPETESFMMLTMSLMVIFNESSPLTFFEVASKRALANNNPHGLLFITWVVNSCRSQQFLMPALRLALKCRSEDRPNPVRTAATQLLYVIAKKNPSLIKDLHIKIDENCDKIIENPNNEFEFINDFAPKPDPFTIKPRPASQKRELSTLFRATNDATASFWLLQLTQELVLCSSSAAIRACRPLLTVAAKLEKDLFPLALVSVWEDADEAGRNLLRDYFMRIINNSHTPIHVLNVITDGADCLDRAGFELFNPFVTGKIAERCRNWFTAIRFFEKAADGNEAPLKHLLKIQAQLKRVDSAQGFLRILPADQVSGALFESLEMWPEARACYQKRIERDDELAGYLNACVKMEDWEAVNEWAPKFNSFSPDAKNLTSLSFYITALHTGTDRTRYLKHLMKDEPNVCLWKAITALREKDVEVAQQWCNRGLSSNVTSFPAPASYESALQAIIWATHFEELKDVAAAMQGADPTPIIHLWERKSSLMRQDASYLRTSMQGRLLLPCSQEQHRMMKLNYFSDLRHLKQWALFDSSFTSSFQDDNDDRVILLRAVVRYDRHITTDRTELSRIVEKLTNKSDEIYASAVTAMAARGPPTQYVITRLSNVIKRSPQNVRAWRQWSYFNLKMTQKSENVPEYYANNAATGFWKLMELTDYSMHYLCQLSSLFFNYGTKLESFELFAEKFRKLESKSALLIVPQLVVQLEHPEEEIRNVVYTIFESLSMEHFQAIALPLNLQRHTKTKSAFIDKIFAMNREVADDVVNFAKTMTQLAVLPAEEVAGMMTKMQKLQDNFSQEVLDLAKRSAIILRGEYKSFLRDWFQSNTVRLFLDRAQKILQSGMKSTNSERVYLFNAVNALGGFLSRSIESITSIDIDELGFNSCSGPLNVVMPGFYTTGAKPVTIARIDHILKPIMSQKRPRKMRIIGSDGKAYKYLLKGREDLRLDQHIMQLFSLVNSILKSDKFGGERNVSIQQYHVVPLATNSGLISWANGGETLRSLVEWHRKIRGRSDQPEHDACTNLIGPRKNAPLFLTPIQKLELFRDICASMPDDDIREAIWLQSTGSQLWLTQVSNFSRSNALMSMVGHVIGLGDRHPLNILLMKHDGKVVHIDLSDCFEKASLRRFVHETVPFRLTRMMVRALGASGVEGIFRKTAENTLSLLRRNSPTLLAFLDIFVLEPVIDALWYKNDDDDGSDPNLFKRAIARVSDKLHGVDEKGKIMTVEDQVDNLIKEATKEENLAMIYYGWCPHW